MEEGSEEANSKMAEWGKAKRVAEAQVSTQSSKDAKLPSLPSLFSPRQGAGHLLGAFAVPCLLTCADVFAVSQASFVQEQLIEMKELVEKSRQECEERVRAETALSRKTSELANLLGDARAEIINLEAKIVQKEGKVDHQAGEMEGKDADLKASRMQLGASKAKLAELEEKVKEQNDVIEANMTCFAEMREVARLLVVAKNQIISLEVRVREQEGLLKRGEQRAKEEMREREALDKSLMKRSAEIADLRGLVTALEGTVSVSKTVNDSMAANKMQLEQEKEACKGGTIPPVTLLIHTLNCTMFLLFPFVTFTGVF